LVEPGFLAPLIAEVAEGRSVAVSPDIRYANAPGLSWFRGSRIDRRQGCPLHLSIADQPPPSAPATPSPVLTGCCIVADAATWRRVGLFDDRLFLVFEDSDWSRRAVADGVELLVVPASRIQHKVSRSFTGTAGRLGGYYFARNGLIFAWRHLGRRSAARFFLRQVVRPATRQLLDPARRADGALSWLGALAAVTGRRGPAGGVVLAVAASSHPSRRTSEPS
jgi:GT2 family glycosyltransferase